MAATVALHTLVAQWNEAQTEVSPGLGFMNCFVYKTKSLEVKL